MTILEEITAIQERIAQAERDLVRAEGARDAAMAARDRAAEELKRDFGVTTVEEGEELLERLRTQLTRSAEQISAQLDEIGA